MTQDSKAPLKKELVIVGGGPAGLTAAIYAQRSLLDAVTLEREAVGGQMLLTGTIDNYPGLPGTDGFSLSDAMRKQASELGAEILMSEVSSIHRDPQNGTFLVTTPESAYETKCVIVAAGAKPRKVGFIGEEQFTGRGVSYCATCDGMFYRGKQVFVIGGGNSAAEEALFLSRIASKVTMVVRKDHLRAQTALVQDLTSASNVEILYNTVVSSVDGPGLLTSIELTSTFSGATERLMFDEGAFGVFVLVGRVPETGLVSDLVSLDEHGYVVTNERMEAGVDGLYVVGDARAKPLRQIVTAASDGAIAASSAAAYLGRPIEG